MLIFANMRKNVTGHMRRYKNRTHLIAVRGKKKKISKGRMGLITSHMEDFESRVWKSVCGVGVLELEEKGQIALSADNPSVEQQAPLTLNRWPL